MHKLVSLTPKKILLVLSLLYFFTRLINLTLLPVFMDEANYLDWGWRSIHEGVTYYSVGEHKQPLLIWIFGIFIEVLPDPLLAGRIVSVLTGFLSMLGLYFIGQKLFNPKTAFITGLLYIFSPILFFFDRQSLMESSLSTISIWTFYFLLELTDKPRLRISLILGLLLGIGFFIKSSILLHVATFVVILFYLGHIQKKLPLYLTIGIYAAMVFVVTVSPLLLQPIFWKTLPTNLSYSLPTSTLAQLPFYHWFYTLFTNLEISFIFFTPLVLIFGLTGLYQLKKNKFTILNILFIWIFVPLLLYTLTTRNPASNGFRYMAPLLPLLLLPAAYFFQNRLKLMLLSLVPCIILITPLLFNPPAYFHLTSKISRYSYAEGYLTGDGTGYPAIATIKYLSSLAQNQPITVAIPIRAFNPEAAIRVYLQKQPNITVAFLSADLLGPIDDLDCLESTLPLYYVARRDEVIDLDRFFTPVTQITNPHNSDYTTIYILKTDCHGKSAKIQITKNK